jgi:hypothetical protein
VLGETEEICGVSGAVMATVTAFEIAGLSPAVSTVTEAVPAVVRSEAGTVAVSEVLETTVVGNAVPFHWMTEFAAKLVPKTVI